MVAVESSAAISGNGGGENRDVTGRATRQVPAQGAQTPRRWRGRWKSNPHACGVDDNASLIQVLFPIPFLEWVTSANRYRVTLRSAEGVRLPPVFALTLKTGAARPG
jgi:hypothetical protein